jgi:hypothetical protein
LDDQAVGILDEDRLQATGKIPVEGGDESGLPLRIDIRSYSIDLAPGNATLIISQLANGLDVFVDRVDILLDMIKRPLGELGFLIEGELGFLIDRTESTLIPGAVPGYTHQETICFTRRTDGTLLESQIGISFLINHILIRF